MHQKILRFLLLLMLALSSASYAAAPSKQYYIGGKSNVLGPFGGASQACGALYSDSAGDSISYAHKNVTEAGTTFTCTYDVLISGNVVTSNASASGWIRVGCPGGAEPVNGQCDDPVCEAGKKQTINFTFGYHATPSTNMALNPVVKGDPFMRQLQKDKGATMCYEGCKVGVPPFEGDDGWVSQVAGPNGLYRSSVDLVTQSTSQNCTEASPEAVMSGTTPPSCPGSLGTVNGATVCLPSVADAGIDGGGEARRGNPTAGPKDETKSPSERAKGPGGDGNGSGPTGSNGGGATGGPATGPNNGSGRVGCNDGSKSPTPACSGKGTNDQDGTKPTTPGKEQANCGAPGQPKCGIDETGTPEKVGDDKYNSKLDQYKTDSKNAADQIKGEGASEFSTYATFFSAPPLKTCDPIELPTVAGVDMGSISKQCDVVDGVRSIMSYIWALVAMWICLGWVKRATA